ncbi:MAG: ABC transporter substrate-binding protein [Desulfarculaceae bacterium]|jgi:peptide/nickel transport system substrate-binding protein
MRKRAIVLIIALVVCSVLAAGVVWAGKSDDTLNILLQVELSHIDNYFNTDRVGVIVSRHIWDSLLYRDPKTSEYKPLLATSYKWVNDTTMDLELRKGVKFHNGEKFDADDVVYTLNWVSDPKNGVKSQRIVAWIKNCEKLGDYKVRIHTKQPFPAALEFLSGSLAIYPNEYYAKVGPKGMGAKPVGTGPYKVTEVVPGQKIVMVKNKDYFKDSPKGRPHIGKLQIRFIKEVNTEIAEIMSGRADWMWGASADQAERLKKTPKLTVTNAQTMRIFYLTFGAADKGKINSPMSNVLVRKAVAHAIDRETILKTLVMGSSKLVNAACFPTQLGCINPPAYDYNPEKAKKLLAQAGLPNGFEFEFYGYRGPKLMEAMVSYLKAVGIKAKMVMGTYAATRDKIRAGRVPMAMMSWGSYSVNDASACTSIFFRGSADDNAMDPKVMEWLKTADTNVDVATRKKYYKLALERIADQVYWLPLWSHSRNYVYTKDLDFTPTPDEIPRWFTSKWK